MRDPELAARAQRAAAPGIGMGEQLASWPPGMLPAVAQRVTSPRSYRAFSTFTLIGGFTAAS
jgi:hypothetical protein